MDAWIPIATVGALFVCSGIAMLLTQKPEALEGEGASPRALPERNAPERARDGHRDDASESASKAVGEPALAKPKSSNGAHEHDEEEDTFIASRADLLKSLDDKPAEKTLEGAKADGGAAPSQELSAIEEPREADRTGAHPLILVHGIACTDPGLRRKNNEDRFLRLEAPHHVYIVADGMGGHAAGEVASQTAVDTIEQAFHDERFPGEADASQPRRGDELVRAVKAANTAVYEKAQTDDAYEKMGTTLVGARFSPNRREVYIVNVGDSRCYRVRSGVLEQITTDHTLGVMLGIKGREAGRLTRAVGIEPNVEVDLITDTPRVGDHYLLCSDGLPRMVPDESILAVLSDEEDLEKAAQRLITRANDLGGRDNITIVIVRVLAPAAAAQQATHESTSPSVEAKPETAPGEASETAGATSGATAIAAETATEMATETATETAVTPEAEAPPHEARES